MISIFLFFNPATKTGATQTMKTNQKAFIKKTIPNASKLSQSNISCSNLNLCDEQWLLDCAVYLMTSSNPWYIHTYLHTFIEAPLKGLFSHNILKLQDKTKE